MGTNTFTAPQNARLNSNTKYWLVFRATPGAVELQLANLGAGDDTAARGFRLFQQNASRFNSSPIRLRMTGQDRDDDPADATTKATLIVGHTANGSIHGYRDRDWFRISLEADTEYRFDDVVHHTNRATVLAIYDADGQRQTAHKFQRGLSDVMRRVYFTPNSSGDYYVAVGTLDHAYGSANAPNGERNYGQYAIKAMLADPEGQDTNSLPTASAGRPYRGDLFTPHDGRTDIDWIKVPAQAEHRYQVMLVSDHRVKTTIANVYDPFGQPLPGFKPISTPARKPLFGTDPDTGHQILTGYGHHDSYDYWTETIFEATHNGPYYVAITGGPASYTQGSQLDHDGHPLPGATATTNQWEFHGADYTFHVWGSAQEAYGESSNRDISTEAARTTTVLDARGGTTAGHINQAGDVDWFGMWMEPGEEYALFLDRQSTDATITAVYELPWPSLNLHGHTATVSAEDTGRANYRIHFYRARREGVHFVAVTGQTTGRVLGVSNTLHQDS